MDNLVLDKLGSRTDNYDEDMHDIFVTRPSLPSFEEYSKMIRPLWESRWLTNMGKYHNEFENRLQHFFGVPYVALMVNGHMALELAIQSFDFPERAEIITTPFTFVSTVHAIIRNKLKPVFCDVNEVDGTLDASKIEALITEKTVAILPVHVYGHICDVGRIQSIANKHGLRVIYDAAHAFGESLQGKSVAQYGDVAVYSFHSTKVFNSIEGGAVATSNYQVFKRLVDLRNFGFRGEYSVDDVGANAKMNEFSAAMGLCNLNRLSESIESRRKIAEQYNEILKGVRGISIFNYYSGAELTSDCTCNYGYYPILVKTIDEQENNRDILYEMLKEEHIYSRKYFYPICTDFSCYRDVYGLSDVNVARKLGQEILCLPIYEGLQDKEVETICNSIKRFIKYRG